MAGRQRLRASGGQARGTGSPDPVGQWWMQWWVWHPGQWGRCTDHADITCQGVRSCSGQTQAAPAPKLGQPEERLPSHTHPRPACFLEVSERGPPSPGARVPGLCIRQSGCQGTSLSFVPQSGCHLPHARHCAGLWGPQSQAEPGMASAFAELPVLGHAGFEQKATATRGNCSLRPAVKARPQRSWVDAAWGGREGPRSC